MNKKIVVLLAFIVLLLGLFVSQKWQEAGKLFPSEQEHGEELKTQDEKDVKKVYEDSIAYGNEKDVDQYVTLIIEKSRKETKKQLGAFFEKYDVKTTLQTFRIEKKSENHIYAEVTQKSVSLKKSDYGDNIAVMNVSFVKIEGKWLIEMSTVVDTRALD